MLEYHQFNKLKSMNKIVLSEGTLQRAGGGENRCGELERMGLGDALVNILWLVADDVTSRYRGRVLHRQYQE